MDDLRARTEYGGQAFGARLVRGAVVVARAPHRQQHREERQIMFHVVAGAALVQHPRVHVERDQHERDGQVLGVGDERPVPGRGTTAHRGVWRPETSETTRVWRHRAVASRRHGTVNGTTRAAARRATAFYIRSVGGARRRARSRQTPVRVARPASEYCRGHGHARNCVVVVVDTRYLDRRISCFIQGSWGEATYYLATNDCTIGTNFLIVKN